MTHELKRQGICVNHKRVLCLMREENLLRRPKKRFVATTNSDHRLPVYPNLADEMDIATPDQLWVSDLTYIRLATSSSTWPWCSMRVRAVAWIGASMQSWQRQP